MVLANLDSSERGGPFQRMTRTLPRLGELVLAARAGSASGGPDSWPRNGPPQRPMVRSSAMVSGQPLSPGAGDGGIPSEAAQEDLEQLATAFRPSWDPHRAAFAGSANRSGPVDSTEFDVPPFARRSTRPLWIALGVGVTVLVALVIWSATGSNAGYVPVTPSATPAALLGRLPAAGELAWPPMPSGAETASSAAATLAAPQSPAAVLAPTPIDTASPEPTLAAFPSPSSVRVAPRPMPSAVAKPTSRPPPRVDFGM
jgi:hypothetical protein